MRLVVQRVSAASVKVDGEVVGAIGAGLLVFVGISPSDTIADVERAVEKVSALRVFPDDRGLMNRSLIDVGGSALVVSQFTLLGDLRRGRRPSFSTAASPEVASPMIDRLVETMRAAGVPTATGVFGATMEVESTNQGPVTMVIDITGGRVV